MQHPEVVNVPLSSIQPGRFDKRLSSVKHRQVMTLAARIAATRIVEPVVVCPISESGNYELVDGHGRYWAARKLGLRELPVIVLEDTTLENIYRRAIHPNDVTVLDDFTRTRLLASYLDEKFAENEAWRQGGGAPEERTLALAKQWERAARKGDDLASDPLVAEFEKTVLLFFSETKLITAVSNCIRPVLTIFDLEELLPHFKTTHFRRLAKMAPQIRALEVGQRLPWDNKKSIVRRSDGLGVERECRTFSKALQKTPAATSDGRYDALANEFVGALIQSEIKVEDLHEFLEQVENKFIANVRGQKAAKEKSQEQMRRLSVFLPGQRRDAV